MLSFLPLHGKITHSINIAGNLHEGLDAVYLRSIDFQSRDADLADPEWIRKAAVAYAHFYVIACIKQP